MGTHEPAGWVGHPATLKTQADCRQLTRVPTEARDERRVAPEGPKSVAGWPTQPVGSCVPIALGVLNRSAGQLTERATKTYLTNHSNIFEFCSTG